MSEMDRDSDEYARVSFLINSMWHFAKEVDEHLFMSNPGSVESEEQIRSRWDTCFDLAKQAIHTQQVVAAIDRLKDK